MWHELWIAFPALLRGLALTLELSAAVILLGSTIGYLGGVSLEYGPKPLWAAVRVYVDTLRGIPVLVLLFAVFYGLPIVGIQIGAFRAGVVALSAFAGAHMTEVVRGGIASIPRTQGDAAKAIGLDFWERLRWAILPQAVRRILPPWANTAVRRGEVVALIGASGSGKTTPLRCINLLEEYDHGQIFVDGELIGYREQDGRRTILPERVIARQRAHIGMVFPSFNLFPHMTAEGNIVLGLMRVQGKSRREATDTARGWLDRVGQLDKVVAYAYQLSGGHQQRVAIARSLAKGRKLRLFDEVPSALDPELVGEVLLVMQDLARTGMTMLVVSHEMLFVREVAHRVVFMDGGRLIEEGSPHELLMNPRSDRLKSFLMRFQGMFR